MGVNPGTVDVVLGFRDEGFRNGMRGARNEVDRLKQEIDGMGGKLPLGFQRAKPAVDQYAQSVKRATVDTKGLTLSMVGLGTTIIGISAASSRLDFAANRLEKTQVAVRRIEDQIASTRKNLNRLTEQGKTNTEDYAVQVGRLETAFADLKTKEEDVKLAQTALNDTQMLFATTIVNTGINSIFLMKSAFAGLSLSQIKATITTKLLGGAVASSASKAFPAYTVSTKAAILQTKIFGVTLKTALLPLLGLTVAFAAWEGLIAPYIKEQTDVNLSILDWTDSMLGAKTAIESTSSELDDYKAKMGQSNELTDEHTKSLRELFGLTKNPSTHPMVTFWEKVKFAQEGSLVSLTNYAAKLKETKNEIGLSPTGNVSAPSGAGTQAVVSTGGGAVITSTSGNNSRRGSVAQQEKQTAETITDVIVKTEDPKMDKAIAESVIKAWKVGEPPLYKDVFGHTAQEALDKMVHPAATKLGAQLHWLGKMVKRIGGIDVDTEISGLTSTTITNSLPTNPLFARKPTKVQEQFGMTQEELDARLAPIHDLYVQATWQGDTALRKFARDASPFLGFNLETTLVELGHLSKSGTAEVNTSVFGESSGFSTLADFTERVARPTDLKRRQEAIDDFFGNLTNPFINTNQGTARFFGGSAGGAIASLQSAGAFFGQGAGGLGQQITNNPILDQLSDIQLAVMGIDPSKLGRRRTGADRPRRRTGVDVSGFVVNRGRDNAAQMADLGLTSALTNMPADMRFSSAAVSGGFVNANNMMGGRLRFAQRNNQALRARKQELSAEKAFRNSMAGIRQSMISNAIRMGQGILGGGFVMGRTQANLVKRKGSPISRDALDDVFDAARFGLFKDMDIFAHLRNNPPQGIVQESRTFVLEMNKVLGKVGTSVDELQSDVAERFGNMNMSRVPRVWRARLVRNRFTAIRAAEIAALQRGFLAAHLGSYAELEESEKRIDFFDDFIGEVNQQGKRTSILKFDEATLTALLQQSNKKDRDQILRELNDMLAFKNKEQYATVLT